MTESILKQLLFFLYAFVATFGTGYVVFWKSASGWWFVLSVFLITFYGAFAFFSEDTKK